MTEPGRGDPLRRFWGACLMAVGALIVTLCGGCALMSAIAMLGFSGGVAELWLPLVLGVLPAVAGIFVFRHGQRLWLRSDEPAPPS